MRLIEPRPSSFKPTKKDFSNNPPHFSKAISQKYISKPPQSHEYSTFILNRLKQQETNLITLKNEYSQIKTQCLNLEEKINQNSQFSDTVFKQIQKAGKKNIDLKVKLKNAVDFQKCMKKNEGKTLGKNLKLNEAFYQLKINELREMYRNNLKCQNSHIKNVNFKQNIKLEETQIIKSQKNKTFNINGNYSEKTFGNQKNISSTKIMPKIEG